MEIDSNQLPAYTMLMESARQAAESPFVAAIITVSDTRTMETDKSGALLAEFCESAGHQIAERLIVKDELALLRDKVSELACRSDVNLILLTGGTGITGRDVTPEAVEPLFDKAIAGFGELFRALSFEEIGAATIQSRATAGLSKGTLIFALPGSTGAVRLAVDKILRAQLDIKTKPCNFASLVPRLAE